MSPKHFQLLPALSKTRMFTPNCSFKLRLSVAAICPSVSGRPADRAVPDVLTLQSSALKRAGRPHLLGCQRLRIRGRFPRFHRQRPGKCLNAIVLRHGSKSSRGSFSELNLLVHSTGKFLSKIIFPAARFPMQLGLFQLRKCPSDAPISAHPSSWLRASTTYVAIAGSGYRASNSRIHVRSTGHWKSKVSCTRGEF